MVGQEGTIVRKRKRSKRLRYFYLNGNLHKALHINRGADVVTTWCYPLKKRVAYVYTDVRRNASKAFTMVEVSELLNRKRWTLEMAIVEGKIPRPQHTYSIDENMNMFKYMFSEDDILAAHAYFKTVHRGRPRKDGLVTPHRLPSERELRAMMNQESILYVKGEDGEFRPTWQADQF